ncbi:MAG: SDR family NAD(P)-dependent oxidoreductase, partial [Prolixibacteraceae bacterium]|nr:SDR family NAD(P)-dependent oxidoreductase [Prolixibacteraceae bacterium]
MGNAALITGASKRLGRAISEHLAGLGWDIIVHFNTSQDEAVELVEELRMRYPLQRFSHVKADLSVAAEAETLIPKVVSEYGKIELLVNN